MDPQAIRELLERLGALERQSVRYRQGVVTTASPLAVALGGSSVPYSSVKTIATGLLVNDVVAVLMFGNDLLVLGKVL